VRSDSLEVSHISGQAPGQFAILADAVIFASRYDEGERTPHLIRSSSDAQVTTSMAL